MIFNVRLQAAKHDSISQDIGVLLYHLASKIKNQIVDKIPFITNYIIEKKLDTVQRVDAALVYLLADVSNTGNVNIVEFEKACGVGVVISPEQIEEEVERVIKAHKDEIMKKR